MNTWTFTVASEIFAVGVGIAVRVGTIVGPTGTIFWLVSQKIKIERVQIIHETIHIIFPTPALKSFCNIFPVDRLLGFFGGNDCLLKTTQATMIGKKCEPPEIFITRAVCVTARSNRGNGSCGGGCISIRIRRHGQVYDRFHLLAIGLHQPRKQGNTFPGFIEIDPILAIRTTCIRLMDHGASNHRLLLRIEAEIGRGAIGEYPRANTLEQAWIFAQQNIHAQLIELTQPKLVQIKARVSGPKL